MAPLLIPLHAAKGLAEAIAMAAGMELASVGTRRFPDGEFYFRCEADMRERPVAILCSLDRPDERILPVLYAAATCREFGARSVGLVAPYLAYMRQDRRFHPGEAVTSRIFAELLSERLDWLVTVDPHLHRHSSLASLYTIPSLRLTAAPLIARWIAAEVPRPVIIGPDEESRQWVAEVAAKVNAPYCTLEKTRSGDRDVEIRLPDIDRFMDRHPVVVDDIVSSAQTMIETVRHLRIQLAQEPVCIGVHALFDPAAEARLHANGAARIVTTNSVPHGTNRIDLSDIVAGGLRSMLAG